LSLKSPRQSLPRLNALRAFEVAARHESFTAAAEELGVTAGAVSQQVKSLETWFGRDLFQRHGHGVLLTEQARAALPELVLAFDSLGAAVGSLKQRTGSDKVNIAALPAIAQLWLTPRLPRLYKALPDVEFSISALEDPPNLNRELYDLSLFLGEAGTAVSGIELATDMMLPVCSPALLAGMIPLRNPADLASHVLLHDATWGNDWGRWLMSADQMDIDPALGPRYTLYSLAVQAAIDGAGVLMGHKILVADALSDGRLVAPFEQSVPSGKSLRLFLPQQQERNTIGNDLIQWFLAENSGKNAP